jgi:hypothetical protein
VVIFRPFKYISCVCKNYNCQVGYESDSDLIHACHIPFTQDVRNTQFTYNVNTEARSRSYSDRRKAALHIYVCVSVCVYARASACSVTYPVYKAHTPFCHLWLLWLYNIFQHYLINGTIFEKQLLNIKSVLWSSPQVLSETFFILRKIQRDIVTNVETSSRELPVILVGFQLNFNSFDRFSKNVRI